MKRAVVFNLLTLGDALSFDPYAEDECPSREQRNRRPSQMGDKASTIVLLLFLLAAGAALSVIVLIEQMGIAACSGAPGVCDFKLLGVTTWITPMVTVLSAALSVAALFGRSRYPRRTQWVPIAGVIFTFFSFLIASWLISVALHGATG